MKNGHGLLRMARFAAAVLLAFGGVARATTLLRMSVEEMAHASRAIVRARCVGTSSRWDAGEIWTFASFEVEEAWRGSPAAQITVRLLGGKAGNLTSSVSGVPRFRTGEEVVLFLEPTPRGDYSVVSWQQGTFRIRRETAEGREVVTQDTAAFSTFDPAHRRFETAGIQSMPVEDFRARVASALQAEGAAVEGAAVEGAAR